MALVISQNSKTDLTGCNLRERKGVRLHWLAQPVRDLLLDDGLGKYFRREDSREKSLLRDSNPWPFAYEANALPTELNRRSIYYSQLPYK